MNQSTCYKCGKTGHLSPDCKVGKVCFGCGSPDHIRSNCPQNRGNNNQGKIADKDNRPADKRDRNIQTKSQILQYDHPWGSRYVQCVVRKLRSNWSIIRVQMQRGRRNKTLMPSIIICLFRINFEDGISLRGEFCNNPNNYMNKIKGFKRLIIDVNNYRLIRRIKKNNKFYPPKPSSINMG